MSRILCVDDNDHNLYMLKTLFERTSYDVIFASTGEEAVTLAATHVPDLVLMDLNLPGIDGCEATRQIKAASATQDIPVIALSGHDEEDKGAAARAAGCCGFVRKPLRIRELLTMVNDLLEARALAPSAVVKGGSPL